MNFVLGKKEILQNFNERDIIALGYEEASFALRKFIKLGYSTSKLFGWRCDYYIARTDTGEVLICTGYDPIGQPLSDEQKKELQKINAMSDGKKRHLKMKQFINKVMRERMLEYEIQQAKLRSV